tara:strand:+ start:343 stop:546 length:204 start_codon:yes stop_codon:yes gene_type:complete
MKNVKQKNNNQLLMKSYTSSLLKGKKSDDIIDMELFNESSVLDFYLNGINVLDSLESYNVECNSLNQ